MGSSAYPTNKERSTEFMLEVEPHRGVQVFGFAIFDVCEKGEIRDAGGGEKILQITQNHACAVEIATFDFLQSRNYRKRHAIILCK